MIFLSVLYCMTDNTDGGMNSQGELHLLEVMTATHTAAMRMPGTMSAKPKASHGHLLFVICTRLLPYRG